MTRITISGINGHLGGAIYRAAQNDGNTVVVAGIDLKSGEDLGIPVFTDILSVSEKLPPCDVIIDCSAPAALPGLINLATTTEIPLVLCTTGYAEADLLQIEQLSKTVPVLRSGNMSVGVNLLVELVKKAAAALGQDFDVEIIERHHRRKADAPSGTAIMLADAAASAFESKPEYVTERASRRAARPLSEIGISSIRGGTIVGEHEVIFAGTDEVIELRHSAYSRDIFALGAIRAAKFLSGTSSGLYTMGDVLK